MDEPMVLRHWYRDMYGMAYCVECQAEHPPAPDIADLLPLEVVHVVSITSPYNGPCPFTKLYTFVYAPPEIPNHPMGVSTTVYCN